MRRTLVVVTVGALLLCSSASAAPRDAPSCRMLVDEEYDDAVTPIPPTQPTSVGSLDIVSGDVASDASRLTAVARVRRLSSFEPGAPDGVQFVITFQVQRASFDIVANRGPEGQSFNLFLREGAAGGAAGAATFRFIREIEGIFDDDASEIRATLPLALIRPYAPTGRGSVVGKLAIGAKRRAGTSGTDVHNVNVSATGDKSTSTATYRMGGRSCVVVGQ